MRMTPEQVKARQRERYELRTPEQVEATRARERVRRASLPFDKKAEEARKASERKAAKIAAMTPEQLAEFRRRRQEGKRRHRAKKYGSQERHTETEWQTLLAACGHLCVRCSASGLLTRDHIVPLTKGGSDAITNIQPLCKPCNSKKNNRHATDYRSGEEVADLTQVLAGAVCAFCGSPYKMTHPRKRFCSRKCSYDFSNRKKREARCAA